MIFQAVICLCYIINNVLLKHFLPLSAELSKVYADNLNSMETEICFWKYYLSLPKKSLLVKSSSHPDIFFLKFHSLIPFIVIRHIVHFLLSLLMLEDIKEGRVNILRTLAPFSRSFASLTRGNRHQMIYFS